MNQTLIFSAEILQRKSMLNIIEAIAKVVSLSSSRPNLSKNQTASSNQFRREKMVAENRREHNGPGQPPPMAVQLAMLTRTAELTSVWQFFFQNFVASIYLCVFFNLNLACGQCDNQLPNDEELVQQKKPRKTKTRENKQRGRGSKQFRHQGKLLNERQITRFGERIHDAPRP